MHDLAFRDVAILDGTGSDAFDGDVAVDGGCIAAVGTVGPARQNLDGAGHALAPGFVDAHTHDDGALLRYPDMWFKTSQGITTVVIGNCGFSATEGRGSAATRSMLLLDPSWEDLDGFRQLLSSRPPAVNAVTLVGHNSLRESLVGTEERPATAAELSGMRDVVQRAMEQGACGVSTGLLYTPGSLAPREELVALAAAVGPFGGIYASHIRNEFADLLPSVAEAIDIGRAAGVPTHVSHHKAAGRDNWGLVPRSLAIIDAAVASGQDVTLDAYPYTAGSGPMAQYFRDGIDLDLAAVMRLATCPSFPRYEGRMLVDLAEEEGRSLEQLVRWILDAPDADRTICLQFLADEADIEANLRHPGLMIGSDSIPQLDGFPHPRLFGTFPRVLGRYVREKAVATLPEMVHRMTDLPARRFGLGPRGRVEVGWHADLVVFDPDRVVDEATYDRPAQASTGIGYVMVGGELVWSDGRATAARPGQLLSARLRTD